MAVTISPDFRSPTTRVVDGNGREWALKTNGVWACLGHQLTVESIDDLDANYIITAVS